MFSYCSHMSERDRITVYPLDQLPMQAGQDRPGGGLAPAKPEEGTSMIRRALSPNGNARPKSRFRTRQTWGTGETDLTTLARRVYDQLLQSNYRIYRSPALQSEGAASSSHEQ